MPRVIIPPPYRGPSRGATQISVEGTTIRECLDAVESTCPGFAALVFTESGELQRFTKLFRNGEQVPTEGLDSVTAQQDEIEVVAGIAGG